MKHVLCSLDTCIGISNRLIVGGDSQIGASLKKIIKLYDYMTVKINNILFF